MKASTTAILLVAFALSGVMGAKAPKSPMTPKSPTTPAVDPHSACYNYFLKKDLCVHASQDPAHRCKGDTASHALEGARLMTVQTGLERRYDNNRPVGVVQKAKLAWSCERPKNPDASWKYGVCVWAGAGSAKTSTGWLDENNKSNCGKQVYIQRRNDINNPKYARIIGGCDFGGVDPSVGCFNVALDQNLFDAFNPTAAEKNSQSIADITWDFNALGGNKPNPDGAN
ncbi:hypothetical protein PGT21_018997 [Puccinia graminis f. sp. tritici]|uniref:Secreted protein n=2 Tax=Puccinia graminis f. sp. tritici TaxID=56615 RepID=E3KA71_PUCGT|nr:uncharacterized protein PGTG_06854 [Puccinia graminis f. sp. tritici CRL 75-36-700-3]EFP81233.1 hypothetical protein PGTG_06854 [Puccinia graminis f. sp. tritici CRL 75-36-700-3]KAA1119252.1 hypothetical protein PGT21_018997 [Puccinia graminis f. sp. tritici]